MSWWPLLLKALAASALVLVVFGPYIVRGILRVILSFFTRHFSVDEVKGFPCTLAGIYWEGNTISQDEQGVAQATRVQIEQLKWRFFSLKGIRLAGKGIKIHMPKHHLAKRLRTYKTKSRVRKPSKSPSPWSASIANRLHSAAECTIAGANRLLVRLPLSEATKQQTKATVLAVFEKMALFICSWLSFGLDPDIEWEVEGVFRLAVNAKIRFQMMDKEDSIRSSFRAQIAKFDLDALDGHVPRRILQLSSALTLEFTSHLWPGNVASLKLLNQLSPKNSDISLTSAAASGDSIKPVMLDVPGLKRLAELFKQELKYGQPAAAPLMSPPMSPASSTSAEIPPPPPLPKPTLLPQMLRRLSLQCPDLQFVRSLNSGDKLSTTFRGVHAELNLGLGPSGNSPGVHYFLGRDANVAFHIVAGWTDVEVLRKSAGATERIAKLGALKVSATSTWVPGQLLHMFPGKARMDFGEESVLLEIDFGGIRSKVPFDFLLSFASSVLPPSEQKATPKQRPSHAPVQIRGRPPRLFFGFDIGSCFFQLTGIEGHPAWPTSSELNLSLPTIHMRVDTLHQGVSLHRSTPQRRRAEDEFSSDFSESSPDGFDEGLASILRTMSTQNSEAYPPEEHAFVRSADHDYLYRANTTVSISSPITVQFLDLGASSLGLGGVDLQHELISFGPFEVSSSLNLPGSSDHDHFNFATDISGHANLIIDQASIRLCHGPALGCLGIALASLPNSEARPSSKTTNRNIAILPDVLLSISIGQAHVSVASSDPFHPLDPSDRGLTIAARSLGVEVFGTKTARPGSFRYVERGKLQLREDVRVQANALVSQQIHQGIAEPGVSLINAFATSFAILPFGEEDLSDTTVSMHRGRTRSKQTEAEAKEDESLVKSPVHAGDWELKGRGHFDEYRRQRTSLDAKVRRGQQGQELLSIPGISVRATLAASSPAEVTISSSKIASNISIYSIYSALMAISTIKSIRPSKKAKTVQHKEPGRPITVRFGCDNLFLGIVLPHDTHAFLHLKHSDIQYDSAKKLLNVQFATLDASVPSPLSVGNWERLISLHSCHVTVVLAPAVSVTLDGKTAQLRIPFKYAPSHIIDNSVTAVKAIKQLVWEYAKGGLGSSIEPQPEGPKHLPLIQVKLKLLLIEAQDDPFECRLNRIWRVGTDEQLARLQRRDAMEELARSLPGKNPALEKQRIEETRHKLDQWDASRWKDRVQTAQSAQGRREEAIKHQLAGGKRARLDDDHPINLVGDDKLCPLLRVVMKQVDLTIAKPKFAEDMAGIRQFLYDTGQLPQDTKFTLLIPLHIDWTMSEAKATLRDYPIPLLHVPPSQAPQEVPAWRLKTDWVIAEDFPEASSIRRVSCEIIPREKSAPHLPPRALMVPRSAMPTKMYALPLINIASEQHTILTWGQAYSPAMSDVSKVFETITKPPPDLSDRVGFWDKFRLTLHGNIQVHWIGQGDMNLYLKGSRDPYSLSGLAAGFIMCWRNDVRLNINVPNKDREVLQVLSDSYILGVPNLDVYKDDAATGTFGSSYDQEDDLPPEASIHPDSPRTILKTVAKLVDGVRWGMAFRLERTCRPEDCQRQPKCTAESTFHRACKTFDFIPHYRVKTRNSDGVFDANGKLVDSYAGFRSDFIHYSLSLSAPTSDQSSKSDAKTYNSMHFSPLLMAHFWRWWELFDSCMSLPIRQGRLFPSAAEPSKKFGRHVATIKYRIDLGPLFLAHTYRQEVWQEWAKGVTSVLGLKGRIENLKLDLHQRAEEFHLKRPEFTEPKTVIHKKVYLAEVHCDQIDARAIIGTFQDPEKAAVPTGEALSDSMGTETDDTGPLSGGQQSWVDLDDFVDLGPRLNDNAPQVQVIEVMTCPAVTYHRQPTDEKAGPDEKKRSKFGRELTHSCLIGGAPEPLDIQKQCLLDRLEELQNLQANCPADQVLSLRPGELKARRQADELSRRMLAAKKAFNRVVRTYEAVKRVPSTEEQRQSGQPQPSAFVSRDQTTSDSDDNVQVPLVTRQLYEDMHNWTNRLMMHSPEITIDNRSRDALFKYYHSARDRKSTAYQLSARVVQFISELAKAQDQANLNSRRHHHHHHHTSSKTPPPNEKATPSAQDILNQILSPQSDGGFHSQPPSTESSNGSSSPLSGSNAGGEQYAFQNPSEDAAQGLPAGFAVSSSFLVILVRPQFLLRSNVDEGSQVALSTLVGVLRSYKIEDTSNIDDPVNSVVMHRNYVELQSAQAFWPRNASQTKWAPVPVEVLLDNTIDPHDFDRISPATKIMIRYEKFNRLRITSQSCEHQESLDSVCQEEGCPSQRFRKGIDDITFNVDRMAVMADQTHYMALYNIATDLLLFSDPSRRERNDRLQAALLLTDLHNLHKRAESVFRHQEVLRVKLEDLTSKQKVLDVMSEQERLAFFYKQAEYLRDSEELTLEIATLRQSEVHKEDNTDNASNGVRLNLLVKDIVWQMLSDQQMPFLKLGVKGVHFDWLSKQDSSVTNALVIQDLQALVCLPNHLYPEMIAKYLGNNDTQHHLVEPDVFLVVFWTVLPPVGGISIVENFELHLHPISLQTEEHIKNEVLDYLFPQRKQKAAPKKDEAKQLALEQADRPSRLGRHKEGHVSKESVDTRVSQESGTQKSTNSHLSPSDSSHRHLHGIRSMDRPAQSSSSAGSSHIASTLGSPSFNEVTSGTDFKAAENTDHLDVEQMKARARLNRTFVTITIWPTVIYFSYHPTKKNSLTTLLDIYGVTIKTPAFVYTGRTWSYFEMMNAIRRDAKLFALKKGGNLLGQVLSHAQKGKKYAREHSKLHQRLEKPKKLLRLGRSRSSSVTEASSAPPPPSPLRNAFASPSETKLAKVDNMLSEDPATMSPNEQEGSDRLHAMAGAGGTTPMLTNPLRAPPHWATEQTRGSSLLEAQRPYDPNELDHEGFSFQKRLGSSQGSDAANASTSRSPPRNRSQSTSARSSSPLSASTSSTKRRESIIEREFRHLLQHHAPKSHSAGYRAVAEVESSSRSREMKEKL